MGRSIPAFFFFSTVLLSEAYCAMAAVRGIALPYSDGE
jgi:hypothetical protein